MREDRSKSMSIMTPSSCRWLSERDGQASGEVRSDETAGFLTQMVVGMLNATITRWLADPSYPIEHELPRAARFAWEAVRHRHS